SGTFYANTSSQVLFSISGQVTDNLGNPISGVSVSNGSGSTTTNSSGNYSFSNLSPGTYTLASSKSGYNACTPTSLGISGPGNKTGQNFVCPPVSTPTPSPTINPFTPTPTSSPTISPPTIMSPKN
ncbi:MAG: carboxypeptidase regulatory-like domain-containing protein, partial [Desulfobacteraceae bacterium]|nr:carboxypeptidase regulatory-like domain-containing protein [Desulfobacteraceae bacterium]